MITVIACVTTVLTACGPPISEAAVGMTVDQAGNPVIVLQNCHADIVQLELSSESTLVVYDNQTPFPTVDQIPLLTGSDEWRPSQSVPKPNPASKFVVKAWSEGHKSSGRRTAFTLADLKALKPGQVRHDWLTRDEPPVYGASPNAPQYRVTSLDDFTIDVCP